MICLAAAMAAAAAWAQVNPCIDRVVEYRPAPGQFVNTMPAVADGATPEAAAQARICGTADNPAPGVITLGAWGGYVTVGWDHDVANVAGEPDFMIYGNAFYATGLTDAGSAEPGVVWVSPDGDAWYELRGSEWDASRRNVTLTYYRPDPLGHDGDSEQYVRYVSDHPSHPEGWLAANTYHTQPYWPEWLSGEAELTFTGTVLPGNISYSADGRVLLDCFAWGYADNLPDADCPGFDIGNAVDASGSPVALDAIRYVRIVTGQIQQHAALGETSTEVRGVVDLHPGVSALGRIGAETVGAGDGVRYYDLQGRPAAPAVGRLLIKVEGARRALVRL